MLGRIKPYYCKGDYIWLDEDGNITSYSREKHRKTEKQTEDGDE